MIALLPSGLPLSKNVTVPVGVPPTDVTVAVKVTLWPKVKGLALEITVVEVAALLTVCAKTDEELPEKLVSPPYVAVMECGPADRLAVEKLA